MASETPVSPEVGSRMVSTGADGPFSASSISARATRSLTEPVGLWDSSLAQMRTPGLGRQALELDERRVPDRLDDVAVATAARACSGDARSIASGSVVRVADQDARSAGTRCDDTESRSEAEREDVDSGAGDHRSRSHVAARVAGVSCAERRAVADSSDSAVYPASCTDGASRAQSPRWAHVRVSRLLRRGLSADEYHDADTHGHGRGVAPGTRHASARGFARARRCATPGRQRGVRSRARLASSEAQPDCAATARGRSRPAATPRDARARLLGARATICEGAGRCAGELRRPHPSAIARLRCIRAARRLRSSCSGTQAASTVSAQRAPRGLPRRQPTSSRGTSGPTSSVAASPRTS